MRKQSFGEFLVEQQILDRFQLFRVLQHQDGVPQTRLGQCVVELGYAEQTTIERLHLRFANATTFDRLDLLEVLEVAPTDAFRRAEIEIILP